MRGVYEKSEGSGVWWIRYVDSQGRLHREVAGTKSAAQKLYQLRKAAILEGRKLPAARKASVTFRQLMEAALLHSKRNKRSYVDDLAHSRRLLEAFGDIPAEAIKPEAVETFLHSHEWGPCTRNRYLATEVGLQARHRGRETQQQFLGSRQMGEGARSQNASGPPVSQRKGRGFAAGVHSCRTSAHGSFQPEYGIAFVNN